MAQSARRHVQRVKLDEKVDITRSGEWFLRTTGRRTEQPQSPNAVLTADRNEAWKDLAKFWNHLALVYREILKHRP